MHFTKNEHQVKDVQYDAHLALYLYMLIMSQPRLKKRFSDWQSLHKQIEVRFTNFFKIICSIKLYLKVCFIYSKE